MKYTQDAIEAGLRDAIVAQTPDVLPDVLRQINKQERLNHKMDTTITMPYPAQAPEAAPPTRKKRTKILRWGISIAAVIALAFGIFLGFLYYQTDAVVSFDVNPSVELRINSREKVLSATALNTDAEVVLGEMDLQGVDLEVAVNALMGSMLKNGYITTDQNTVLISVESGNTARGDALQQQLATNVQGILSQSSVEGAVISQSLSDDESLRAQAQQYDISLGKAALINLLMSQDPTLDFAQLATLSVNDIYLLLSARQTTMDGVATSGQPATGAYIGDESAKRIALEHAGVAEADVRKFEIDMDFEDGRMVYEVEFKTDSAKYEYEIDAQSGAILEYKHNGGNDNTSGNNGASTGAGTDVSANFIGLEAAKAIALNDAGQAGQSVTFVKTTWYEKHSVYLYDIQFLTNTHKYSYEINAVSGEIIASYIHERDGGGSGGSQNQQGQTGNYIGDTQAKSIALSHAGVAESALVKYDIELKYDDGRMIYEIEFTANGMEYEYEIDAVTGDILDWEAERD